MGAGADWAMAYNSISRRRSASGLCGKARPGRPEEGVRCRRGRLPHVLRGFLGVRGGGFLRGFAGLLEERFDHFAPVGSLEILFFSHGRRLRADIAFAVDPHDLRYYVTLHRRGAEVFENLLRGAETDRMFDAVVLDEIGDVEVGHRIERYADGLKAARSVFLIQLGEDFRGMLAVNAGSKDAG